MVGRGGSEFESDGQWSNNEFNIYRASNTLRIEVSKDTVSVLSDPAFDVDIDLSASTRYVVVMAPQAFRPGEQHGPYWGRTNSMPDDITAGQAVDVDIYVCDEYGNRLTGQEGVRSIALNVFITDALMTPTTAQSVNANITGLSPETANYFRVKAINSAGTAYGANVVFLTPHWGILSDF